MIQKERKKALSDFADFIAQQYSIQNVTQLEAILQSEDIQLCVDQYENIFDGMLVYDDNQFYIHLNSDRGNDTNTLRGRFSLAHELAHYFIDEHRIPLMTGEIAPHGSLHEFDNNNLIEEEADYFAASLLMPETTFRNVYLGKKFSLDSIKTLSQLFNTSILSTIIRFAEVGRHPNLVVFSKNNIVKWFAKHPDFPNWKFRFSVHGKLPPLTVAGEFFKKENAKYTSVEEVDPENWLVPSWKANSKMHEQCYFSEVYGFVISVIWFD